AADPEFGLAHCLKGYFAMLLYKQAGVAPAAQSARTARPLVAKATAREQSHVEALDAWAAGDLDRTLAIWEAILADYPTAPPPPRLRAGKPSSPTIPPTRSRCGSRT